MSRFLIRLVSTLALLSCASFRLTSAQNATEMELAQEEILLKFFDMTNGFRWRIRTNWISEEHYCYWYGITCYEDEEQFGMIRAIEMVDNKLGGVTPPEIFQLPHLEKLVLKNSPDLTVDFSGIEKATKLKELKLSDNALTSISGIGMAPALEVLHLTGNNLDGELPRELFDLTSLRALYCNFNSFTGTIHSRIKHMTNLEELFFHDNDLSGPLPPELGFLTKINTLALAQNSFTGTIPPEMNNLSNLVVLALQREDMKESNGLTGTLPSFDGLTSLEELYLSDNSLSGRIPETFLQGVSDHGKEIQIDLSSNQLIGEIPTHLLHFPRLDIKLANNQIDSFDHEFCKQDKWQSGDVATYGCDAILCPPGTFAEAGRQSSEGTACQTCGPFSVALNYGNTECLSTFNTVKTQEDILEMIYHALDGKFWKAQQNWLSPAQDICTWYGITCKVDDDVGTTLVTKISLANNELMGRVPQEIFLMEGLEFLDLSGNSIEMSFNGIENAKNLRKLLLSSTGLKSLEGISKAPNVDMLDVGSNRDLTVDALEEISQMHNLRALLISHNNFRGSLPAEIFKLENLVYLRAYGSGFNGQIPPELGQLSDLIVLDIAENDFTGTIPTELNLLTNLELFSIHQVGKSGTGLTGKIPSFSDLSGLTELYLDSNSLSGTLPKDLLRNSKKLTGKITIGLSKNELEGDIPADYARFENLDIDLTDNRIGGIPEVLCSKTNWQNGWVDTYGCEAILCPTETFSTFGKRSAQDYPCKSCSEVGNGISPFLGATKCLFDDSGLNTLTERDILEKIFFLTEGRSWNNNKNWLNEAVSTCEWYGVSCETGTTDDKVISLNLTENGLSGEFPTVVFELPFLEELFLKGNSITISFDGIEKASNLKHFSMSETGLSSFDGIQKAPALEVLHATDNDLAGPFPTEILQLTKLKELYLNYNMLTGRIPAGINSLTDLEQLFLFQNQFSGQIPDTIGDLTNLRVLTISVNDLSGTLPEELNSLTKLEILSLEGNNKRNGNGIGGPLLPLSGMESLSELYLNSNSLTGTIPKTFLSGIKDKSGPIKADLISNNLEGTIPGEFAEFRQLRLYVADNRIEGISSTLCRKDEWMNGDVGNYECNAILCPPNTFSSYGRHNDEEECQPCGEFLTAQYYGSLSCVTDVKQQALKQQQILELFYDNMGGSDWKIGANWKDSSVSICEWYGITCISSEEPLVKSINLPRNGLKGDVPEEIFNLSALREIDFSSNLVGFSFSGVEKATRLKYLNLDNTGLTHIDGIENANHLIVLHLMTNRFSQSSIPEGIFSLKKLEMLYLSENDFSGELPHKMKNLSKLKYFSCFACGLEGTLPNWIGDLSNLEYVRLDENSFSGNLPSSLSSLENLQHLDLSLQGLQVGKGFTGTLPEFSGCPNLNELFLYANSIHGTIPSSFLAKADHGNSIEADLRFNDLEGSLPKELESFDKLSIYLSGNRINSLSDSLCSKKKWMKGDVGSYDCNGLLCPPGTYNDIGRESQTSQPCKECPEATYFGSTSCGVQYDDDDDDDTEADDKETTDYSAASEKELLELLYRKTRGDTWIKNDNWLSGVTICEWYGVECSDENVVAVRLESNGLSGSLPSEFFFMSFLKELDLKENNMKVSFEGIENAKRLRELVVSDMGLTSIEGIGKAPVLEILHLTENELIGNIPKELFEITSLKKLYANYNKFSGTIPTEIGKLSGLSELYLYHNMLSGELPTELGLLSNLEIVTLAENIFVGTLPTELNNLVNMKIFAVQRENSDIATITKGVLSGLSGPLISFSGWKQVREIYLGSNKLTGEIPPNLLSGIEDKSAPVKIDLTMNKLTGSLPSELAAFDQLRIFVAGNELSGLGDGLCKQDGWLSGTVGDFKCDAILCPPNTFNEYGRQPSDEMPCRPCEGSSEAAYFGSLSCGGAAGFSDIELTEFDILMLIYEETGGIDWHDNNNWGDEDIDICNWYGVVCASDEGGVDDHVTKLVLGSNNLKGSMPIEVFALPALSSLELQDNNDLEFHFTEMGRATKLHVLNVDATKVKSLDAIGGASDSLISLSMQDNDFGGVKIPPELFNYDRLKYLNIANSNLKGTLPGEIENLLSLEEFHCSGNDLTGQIPESIGNLRNLEVLAMSENDFSGTLPTEMEELRNLRGLFIDTFSRDSDGIGGPLLAFANSPDLVDFYLGGNSLTGEIPLQLLSGIADPMQEVNIMLKSNFLSGVVPATLARFKRLNIDLAGNRIEGMHPDLCQKRNWMGGKVSDYECDAILCPPGTFNLYGRQSVDEAPCQECVGVSSPYYGAFECGTTSKITEKDILQKFYHQCGGDNWKNKENWLDPNIDYCDWYGIACHEDEMVDSILMGSNNIVCTPPKELFELKHLKWLWLYSNPVSFDFDGIEQATKLTSLLIDSTSTTSIDGIGKATHLEELDMRFNNIQGKISDEELENLSNLVSLSLSDNQFSGSIPAALQDLSNLKKLRLGNNKFSGTLPDFATHTELKSIDLSGNKLSGTIPKALLQNVHTNEDIFVDLSHNRLSGMVPGSLSRFDSLTIYLRENHISAIDPVLCSKDAWMEGDVGDFDCDGLLCKPGSYSEIGRESKSETCKPCKLAAYYGSSNCGLESSSIRLNRGILGTIGFLALGMGYLAM